MQSKEGFYKHLTLMFHYCCSHELMFLAPLPQVSHLVHIYLTLSHSLCPLKDVELCYHLGVYSLQAITYSDL